MQTKTNKQNKHITKLTHRKYSKKIDKNIKNHGLTGNKT